MILFQVLAAQRADAQQFQGRCVGVSDGDTVTLLVGGRQEKVRLYGIDAPEKAQAFGQRARQYAASIVFGRQAGLERIGMDRYGRTIGKVFVDGRSLNEDMLRAGLAWHYKAYSHDADLAALEVVARQERRGIWADSSPVPPWAFRRAQRSGDRPGGLSAAGMPQNATSEVRPSQGAIFRGNTESHVFHKPGCRNFNCPKCTVAFRDRQSAITAGYRPCGVCRP
jgi:endonuclease YncB( thermonuclease family)